MGQNTSQLPKLSKSAPLYSKEQLEKFYQKRKDISREILETEERYVAGLRCLLEMYVNPLTERKIIQPKYFQKLFTLQYSEIILNFQLKFLEALKNRVDNWNDSQCIGDIFIQNAEGLKTYTTYVVNYTEALGAISELRQTNPEFSNFLQEQRTNHPQRLDLFDLLITPIQRIPRYQLLLQDLTRNTPENHNDYPNLTFALEKIQEINIYINEEQKIAEKLQHFINFQAEWVGRYEKIVIEGRRLIQDGNIKIFDERKQKVKVFWYFFFNDLLVLVAPEKGMSSFLAKGKSMILNKGNTTEKGLWRLHETAPIEEVDTRNRKNTEELPFCIEIITKQSKYLASLTTEEEKQTWVQTLEQLKQQLKEERKSKKPKKHKVILSKIFGTKMKIQKAFKDKISKGESTDLPSGREATNDSTLVVTLFKTEETTQDKLTQVFYVMRVELGNSSWIIKKTFHDFEQLNEKFKSKFGKKSELLKFPSKSGHESVQEKKEKLQKYVHSILGNSDFFQFYAFENFLELKEHKSTSLKEETPNRESIAPTQSNTNFFRFSKMVINNNNSSPKNASAPNSPSLTINNPVNNNNSTPNSSSLTINNPTNNPVNNNNSAPTSSSLSNNNPENNSSTSANSVPSETNNNSFSSHKKSFISFLNTSKSNQSKINIKETPSRKATTLETPSRKTTTPETPSRKATTPETPNLYPNLNSLNNPPGEDWTLYQSEEGHSYYFNHKTGESRWA